MSKYRKIDVRIWNDAKFREFSHNAKLVFFLLLTHPNMTSIGAMRATLSGLAEEMNMDLEAFREAFREAFLKGMVKHDAKACLIALPNFIKYNQPESPNVVKAWASSLDLLPECDLKNEVITLSANALKGYSKAFQEALPEAFRKTYPKSMPNQEQEQEQEQEQLNTHTKSASEEKKEQSIIDNLTKDTRLNFAMEFDWQPNQTEFEGYCKNTYSFDPKKLTPEILKEFIGKAKANGEKHTETKWCKFLAAFTKKWINNPELPAKQNSHIYQSEQQTPSSGYKPPENVFVDDTPRQPKEVRERMAKKLLESMQGVIENVGI